MLDLSTQYQNNQLNIQTLKNELKFLEDEIKNIFNLNNISFSVDINLRKKTFVLDYSNSFSEVKFTFSQANSKIRIKPFILFHNSYQSDVEEEDSLNSVNFFLSDIHKIKDKVYSFNKDKTINQLNKIKQSLKEMKILEEEEQQINNEKIKLELKKDFNVINQIFPKINTFCIDSFMCDLYGIPYKKMPTRKNIQDLKTKIKTIDIKNGLEFLVYIQEDKKIIFSLFKLIINKEKGIYYIQSDIATARTKKQINETLSNQCIYNELIMTKNDIINNDVFQLCQEYPNHNYWKHSISVSYDVLKISNMFSKEALSKNIDNF